MNCSIIALAAGILWTNKGTIIIDIRIHNGSHGGNNELGQETQSKESPGDMIMIDFP